MMTGKDLGQSDVFCPYSYNCETNTFALKCETHNCPKWKTYDTPHNWCEKLMEVKPNELVLVRPEGEETEDCKLLHTYVEKLLELNEANPNDQDLAIVPFMFLKQVARICNKCKHRYGRCGG